MPDLPPIEPPSELHVPAPGVWRVAAQWVRRHQADERGRRCKECGLYWPCFGYMSALDILQGITDRCLARTGGGD